MSRMAKKLMKPVSSGEGQKKQDGYRIFVAGLMILLSAVLLISVWYTFYLYVMPALSMFFYGWAIPHYEETNGTVMTAIAVFATYWAIPCLFLCGSLNVLLWKATRLFIRKMKKLYKFVINRMQEVRKGE